MLGPILPRYSIKIINTKGEEDRVANFAPRVADGLEQEGQTSNWTTITVIKKLQYN